MLQELHNMVNHSHHYTLHHHHHHHISHQYHIHHMLPVAIHIHQPEVVVVVVTLHHLPTPHTHLMPPTHPLPTHLRQQLLMQHNHIHQIQLTLLNLMDLFIPLVLLTQVNVLHLIEREKVDTSYPSSSKHAMK